MKNFSDFELINLSIQGESEAFTCLVERHSQLVFKVAFKWCGIKEDAEDITQEVFIKLAESIFNFKADQAAFTSWLYKVTINTSKDYQRKQRTRCKKETDFAHEQKLIKTLNSNEKTILQSEAFYLMAQLPEKEKEALFLVVYEGLNHKQAAKIMGCAETTVSWRMHNAKKKLKKWVEQ